MKDFLMFYAPFIVLFASLLVAFWIAPMDRYVRDEEDFGE